MSSFVLGASTVQSVGTVIAVLALIGFALYVIFNARAGKREVGSEIELAPNRKPYVGDDKLETTKLDRTLLLGLGLLIVIAVGLPLYWLHEPGRQDAAVATGQQVFISRGEEQFTEGSDCASCHGPEGGGGQATYTLLDGEGEFVASVGWTAPALDTAALRFSREELAEIIEFGRPGTPMVGWGEGGDGPRTTQEIDNLVDYIFSIAKSPEEAQRDAQVQLAVELGELDPTESDPDVIDAALENIDYMGDPRVGETLFNLGKEPAFDGGAYACARCHTKGWSIVTEGMEPADADIGSFIDYRDGSGSRGPALDDEVPRQFATVDQLAEFISAGTAAGEGYGQGQGQGSGMMPGFGDDPNTEASGDGMYTPEMICAVAQYVATLPADEATEGPVPTFSAEDDAFCAEFVDDPGGPIVTEPAPAGTAATETAESGPAEGAETPEDTANGEGDEAAEGADDAAGTAQNGTGEEQ